MRKVVAFLICILCYSFIGLSQNDDEAYLSYEVGFAPLFYSGFSPVLFNYDASFILTNNHPNLTTSVGLGFSTFNSKEFISSTFGSSAESEHQSRHNLYIPVLISLKLSDEKFEKNVRLGFLFNGTTKAESTIYDINSIPIESKDFSIIKTGISFRLELLFKKYARGKKCYGFSPLFQVKLTNQAVKNKF